MYLARLGSCILKSPDYLLNLIFDPSTPWTIPSLRIIPAATAPNALTESMCRRLLPVIRSPESNFSPDTVPFALCILLRYRMMPRDHFLANCEPAHLIMAAVLLANAWLSDYETNVYQFAHMAGVTPNYMRELKLRLLQNLQYGLWIPDDEFHRHNVKLNGLWMEVYRPVAHQGLPPNRYQFFTGVTGWFV